jgi:hypothetical protein
MGDWVRVEFWGQLPDGMQISEVDDEVMGETLARTFGFSRVARVALAQANDGSGPSVRMLIDDRDREFDA